VEKKYWSFSLVEEKLVEAMQLWRRSPGGGSWPFASDGPWHLVQPDDTGAARAEILLNAEREGKPAVEAPKRMPLTRDEVKERDEVSEWMRFAPERDRKLVAVVTDFYARGYKQIKWKKVRDVLIRSGEPSISARGLGMRYSRAITAIAKRLNSPEMLAGGVSTLVN
jgi:hypothetical protein